MQGTSEVDPPRILSVREEGEGTRLPANCNRCPPAPGLWSSAPPARTAVATVGARRSAQALRRLSGLLVLCPIWRAVFPAQPRFVLSVSAPWPTRLARRLAQYGLPSACAVFCTSPLVFACGPCSSSQFWSILHPACYPVSPGPPCSRCPPAAPAMSAIVR